MGFPQSEERILLDEKYQPRPRPPHFFIFAVVFSLFSTVTPARDSNFFCALGETKGKIISLSHRIIKENTGKKKKLKRTRNERKTLSLQKSRFRLLLLLPCLLDLLPRLLPGLRRRLDRAPDRPVRAELPAVEAKLAAVRWPC